MKKKIKTQKGFIQIPLLIGIIISLVTVSALTTGVIFYKKGKLPPLVSNVSEVFKDAEKVELDIKSEKSQPKEQSPSEEINQTEDFQAEQELKQDKLEAEKAKQEFEQSKAETERLKAEQEAQRIAKERQDQEEQKRKELKRKEAEEKRLTEQRQKEELERKEAEEYMTKIHQDYLSAVLKLDIEGFEYLRDYLENNVIPILNQRLLRINILKNSVNRTVVKFPEVEDFQLLLEGVNLAFDETEFYIDNFIWRKDYLQESINALSRIKTHISVQPVISDTGVDNIYDWINLLNSYEESFDTSWDYIDDSVQDYKENTSDMDYKLDIAFNLILPKYSYSTYQYIPSSDYQSYYTYPIQNWLDNTYKQRQLETLQGIDNNLHNILQELRY